MEQKHVYVDHWSGKEYYNKCVEMSEEWVRKEQRGFVKIDFMDLGKNVEKKLWSNVFLNTLDSKQQSFNLKVIHAAVPTMEVIGGRSFKFKTKYCVYCSKVLNISVVENVEHILIECIIARSTWFTINDKLRNGFLQPINVDKNTIFYKFGMGKPQNHLISEVNWALWCNRCTNVYEDEVNSHVGVVKKIISNLKKNSRLDKNILSIKVYNTRWLGLNQAIEAVDN